jgi:oxygen-independent coproporphyrinogen-3 oxidase
VRRGHGERTALDAVRSILSRGFILNVDLMYGLPGQSRESLRRDVARLAAEGVHSFTLYDLRLSATTPVAGRLKEEEWLSLGRLMGWRAFVAAVAGEHGYRQTRWHTFKREGGAGARHRRAPCNTEAGIGFQLGLGMSARSHLGDTVYRNHRSFDEYIRRVEAGESPVEDLFPLGERDRMTQHVCRSLGDGKILDRSAYAAAFGRSVEADFPGLLERLRAAGAIEETAAGIALSEAGRLVHDLVTLAFYPEPIQAWLRARQHPALAPSGAAPAPLPLA